MFPFKEPINETVLTYDDDYVVTLYNLSLRFYKRTGKEKLKRILNPFLIRDLISKFFGYTEV